MSNFVLRTLIGLYVMILLNLFVMTRAILDPERFVITVILGDGYMPTSVYQSDLLDPIAD
jgi:hypothetical protein